MKKILFAISFFSISVCAQAQRVFFMYLQSENGTPFFVKMADKIHSSTSSGYVILSSLKDSTYAFSIGYPGAQSAETKFSVVINGGDKGFLIKAFEDGPALFDLQNLTVSKPLVMANSGGSQQTITRTDSFTKLLSQTSNDATLLIASAPIKEEAEKVKEVKVEPAIVVQVEKPEDTITEVLVNTNVESIVTKQTTEVEKKEEEKIAPPAEVNSTTDTVIVRKSVEEKPADIVESNIEETPFVRSVVTRRSESSTTEGFGLVYLDNENGIIDTIRLLIPNLIKPFKEDQKTKEEKETIAEIKEPEVSSTQAPISSATSVCRKVATDKDFLRLRRNMAAETNDERMIAAARKYFKGTCFTTEQIRNLSALFLTSAARYQFFDAAFGHVSDSSQFASLGLEIRDEYYSKRFKALIGE